MLINSTVYYCVNNIYTFLSTMKFYQNRESYTQSDLKKMQLED